ncbi:MAG: hypothetical protein N4A54_09675 [Peptostreptococcaceae bacterium]|jgi:hypothetical protein|nr:hypothetical protein [Peptostreptococcaceae bacterium]
MKKKFKLIILVFLCVFLIYSLKMLLFNEGRNKYLSKECEKILNTVNENKIEIENKDLMEELKQINNYFNQKNIAINNLNYIKESKDKKYIVLKIEFDCNLNQFLNIMIFFKNKDYNVFDFMAKKNVSDFNFILEAKTDYEKIK